MDATQAGGRNTQPQPTPGAASLETDLQNVADSIAALLTDARAIDPERDEFGHARSRAYTDAVALLKVSAKLGHSIAALRGSKFEHNINVRREDAAASRKRASAADDDDEPFDEEFEQYQGCNYDGTFQFDDGTFFVHGRGRIHIPPGWDEERWRAGLPQRGGQGDPLPISGGSNGNFDVTAEPKVRSL
jgi:hypothetical protein